MIVDAFPDLVDTICCIDLLRSALARRPACTLRVYTLLRMLASCIASALHRYNPGWEPSRRTSQLSEPILASVFRQISRLSENSYFATMRNACFCFSKLPTSGPIFDDVLTFLRTSFWDLPFFFFANMIQTTAILGPP